MLAGVEPSKVNIKLKTIHSPMLYLSWSNNREVMCTERTELVTDYDTNSALNYGVSLAKCK